MENHRYVAFLRGINLGNRRVRMSQLQTLFEELGLQQAQTFIASGNILFSTPETDTARLESRIAQHLEASLHYSVDTFVRTLKEVGAIATRTVFKEEGQPSVIIHVAFMHQELAPEVARNFTSIRTDVDEFRVLGREYYWLCRVRTSESKVWLLPAIKALRLPAATMRNLTSIRKLIAKHPPELLPKP